MDPIIIEEYISERTFHLHDYSWWGGNYLLLRSDGGMFLGDSIDLIFLGTDYIELPMKLNGVCIYRPRNEEALEYQTKNAPYPSGKPGDRVFAIESEGKRFHVIASKLWVQVHASPKDESSLNSLGDNDPAKQNGYIRKYVKEWYKIDSV